MCSSGALTKRAVNRERMGVIIPTPDAAGAQALPPS
jgi:hypothetical protein